MDVSVFPFYPRPRTPFLFDTKVIEITIICLVTATTFIIIFPGIRGKLRTFWLVRVLTSILIGAVILTVNFTRDWEVGSINTKTVYKSFSNVMVNASIGLWIGLKGVNITLTGHPIHQLNETINYNEKFAWETRIQYDRDYQEGLDRGLPNPILYVAEKFNSNSPCMLHQQYCVSTYYSSILMWTAFCFWIFSNILFLIPVPLYGICMMFTTAMCIIVSLISFAIVKQVPACDIHFGSVVLETQFGLSFWLSFATGILCIFISTVLLILHILKPNIVRRLFDFKETGEVCNKSDSEENCPLTDDKNITTSQML